LITRDRDRDAAAQCAIRVSHVCASFGADQPDVLRDVSCQFQVGRNAPTSGGTGSKVAASVSFDSAAAATSPRIYGLCGRSGSGKSTLAAVLARAHLIHAGSIDVCGFPHFMLPLRDYRALIRVYPQESYALGGETVRAFLDRDGRHGDAAVSALLARLVAACNDAVRIASDLDKGTGKVSSSSLSLDTAIRGGGANLAAGERQILAIAHATLGARRTASTRLVILDETLSHLDGNAARAVLAVVRESLQSETVPGSAAVLLITHRPELMRVCDELWLMEAGQIVDRGHPDVVLSAQQQHVQKE
jgi:ABC-type multidrug transport system fused ATPase/permease subunit